MADSYYNYEASKEVLIRRLSEMYKSAWSPTPERKELKALAKHLNKTVDLLQNNRWLELEENIDNPSLWETGIDRNIAPSESRPGYFQSTAWRLREIADTALAMEKGLPEPRERNEIPYAATCLLHLMYQCEMPKPTLYDGGMGVNEMAVICREAGIVRSPETYRNTLSVALLNFDPNYPPLGIDEILVINQ